MRQTWAERWEGFSYLVRSMLIGVVLVIPGVVLLFVAAFLSEPPPPGSAQNIVWPTLLANLGTTLISIGVVGVLYEGFLKDALMRTLRADVGINSALFDTGLVQVSLQPEELRLGEIFAESITLDIFPANPLEWRQQNFGWLTRLAGKKVISCRVYLPEPAAYSALRGLVPGAGVQASAEQCEDSFGEYVNYWKDARIASGSTLQRLAYQGHPHGGFIVGDHAAVIYILDVRGRNTAVGGVAYVYRGLSAQPTIDWLRMSVSAMNTATIDGSETDVRSIEDILPLSPAGQRQTTGVKPEGGPKNVQ